MKNTNFVICCMLTNITMLASWVGCYGTGGGDFDPPTRHHSFVDIDHEICQFLAKECAPSTA